MTSTPPREPSEPGTRRIAVVGTGLIGTSVALAATRAGFVVTGWDELPDVALHAEALGALTAADSLEAAVVGAALVVVATPIDAVARTVALALEAAPEGVVTDVASIKGRVVGELAANGVVGLDRFVPGHPMGGSERSGPEHASASVVDGIVWVVAPSSSTSRGSVEVLESFIRAVGARPVQLSPERHDRLVAFVSHLPQIASTALMGLAASEEADEPDILLLAAGGFRDLTRLAASNPRLWSEIVLANRDEILRAIDLYVERLGVLRDEIDDTRGEDLEATFDRAKTARLRLAAKPQVRAGVAVVQTEIPDEPGALARIAATMGEGAVNIEDLQIVHSPEGGRGTVHVTVAASHAQQALDVLVAAGYDPIRLA